MNALRDEEFPRVLDQMQPQVIRPLSLFFAIGREMR
jgi:hypothetical protein